MSIGVQSRGGYVAPKFFLPFGDLRELESDLFSLAECWQFSFEESLRIPSSRRKRALRWKKRLGEKMQAKAKEKNSSDSSLTFSPDDVAYIWPRDFQETLW